MTKSLIAILLLGFLLSCNKDYIADKGIDLDVINAITIDEDLSYGVSNIPSDAGSEIIKFFDKYTRVVAHNGKYIHLFAPSNVSEFDLARQREVLKGILKDHPGSPHGNDKSAIGNHLANQNACVMYFNSDEDLKSLTEGVLLISPIEIHPILFENIFTEGSSTFISGNDIDKSMTKLMRMVLKSGVANTDFGYNSEVYNAANNARNNSVWIPANLDTLLARGDLGWSYITMMLEVYYGQWEKSGIVNGGEYLYPDRTNLSNDPVGLFSIEVFFQSFLPYKVIMDPDFSSNLEMEFNASKDYTYRSQYFSEVSIEYALGQDISANEYNNRLTGNALDNNFEGKSGDDWMDGKDGFDVAIFSGNRNDYLINTSNGYTVIQDTIPSRDGLDSLMNFERLQFQDMNVDL